MAALANLVMVPLIGFWVVPLALLAVLALFFFSACRNGALAVGGPGHYSIYSRQQSYWRAVPEPGFTIGWRPPCRISPWRR